MEYQSQCRPFYRLLSDAQIERLHQATLELLDRVGVKVMLPEAVTLLADAGCRVEDENRVYIPARLVAQAIERAPARITIYNRLGVPAMELAGRNIHFGLGTDLVQTYDLTSGELRDSCLQDVTNAACIADALPEIDFIGSYALPRDVPANLMYLQTFHAQLEHSIKPIFYTAAGVEDIALINEMAAAVMGGAEALRKRPIHIHYAEPMTPLTHTTGALQKLLFCAEHGVPVCYTPGMMSGASAPVTLAGAIALGNAEALSGLVIHQLRGPGAPIISGFGMSTLDMRSSACIYGCPEYRLALSACADLYHHYQLPMWGTAGVSDSVGLDQQAGMEWTASIMTDAMNGANLIHDVGYLGQGLIGHPGALVMCAEIISYVKRFTRGFGLEDEHLALDLIEAVGPGGEFLSTDHTMAHFKSEHWQPGLGNRDDPEAWRAKGGQDWGEKAVARAREILSDHTPEPLGEGVDAQLEGILKKGATVLQGKHIGA